MSLFPGRLENRLTFHSKQVKITRRFIDLGKGTQVLLEIPREGACKPKVGIH